MNISRNTRSYPRQWSPEELQDDIQHSIGIFRSERLGEPLDLYLKFFDSFATIFGGLIDQLPSLTSDPIDANLAADLLNGKDPQRPFGTSLLHQFQATT
jgi:hypothetical protein